jgi:hypothetical protein
MFSRRKTMNMLKARSIFGRPRHIEAASWARVFLAFVAAAGIILLASTPFVAIGLRFMERASAASEDLKAAERSLSSFDLDGAEGHRQAAEAKLSLAETDLGRLSFLSVLPWFGPRYGAADSLIDAGWAATDAMDQVIMVGQDLISTLGGIESFSGGLSGLPDLPTLLGGLKSDEKRQILAALHRSAPRVSQAISEIDSSISTLEDLQADPDLGAYAADFAPLTAKLKSARETLSSVEPLVGVLPEALGYPEARHYLLFFQNSTELRPTGGFLSMVGIMTVKDADMTELTMDDVYAYDGPSEKTARPEAPAPIRKYLGLEDWYLRDANWSPDFTVSSQKMIEFFEDEYEAKNGAEPPKIDGVIAVTPKLAQDALRLTGPVTVDGIKFTADNLIDALEFQVEMAYAPAGIPKEQRKDIVGRLMEEVLDMVKSLPFAEALVLADDVKEALVQGDILLYSDDPTVEAAILENGWGGRLVEVEGDYLMVIDANLASLKTDAVMSRAVSYSIKPSGDGYEGTVAITYKNGGGFSWKTTRYRTYTRVYLPAGTELIGVKGALVDDKLKNPSGKAGTPDTYDEIGRRSFGAFISVEPGRSGTLEFSFKLASAVAQDISSGGYSLDAQRQPGTYGTGLTLDLDFGKKVQKASPAENEAEFGDTSYRIKTDLSASRSFDVKL